VQSTSGASIAEPECKETTNWLPAGKGLEDRLARGVVAPGGEHGRFDSAFAGFGKEHAGAAPAPPGACDRSKGGRMSGDEFFLLGGG
jgi:hypothetical protein